MLDRSSVSWTWPTMVRVAGRRVSWPARTTLPNCSPGRWQAPTPATRGDVARQSAVRRSCRAVGGRPGRSLTTTAVSPSTSYEPTAWTRRHSARRDRSVPLARGPRMSTRARATVGCSPAWPTPTITTSVAADAGRRADTDPPATSTRRLRRLPCPARRRHRGPLCRPQPTSPPTHKPRTPRRGLRRRASPHLRHLPDHLPETLPNALLQDRCPHCHGTPIDWTDHATVVPFTRRLDDIRQRLSDADPKTR